MTLLKPLISLVKIYPSLDYHHLIVSV